MNKLSRSNDQLEKLKNDNKVRLLDKQNQIRITEKFNKFLEFSRSQYVIKDARSNISASKTILTT